MRAKLQVRGIKSKGYKIKQSQTDRDGSFEEMKRYLCPLAEDLPLLKTHYPNEWFQRIDGNSIVQRWKDESGIEHHIFMYYPAPRTVEFLENMEKDWTIRNDYFLLLWKRLQTFGIAKYSDVPCDVTICDFDKYLNKNQIKRFQLKANGTPVVTRFKLNVNNRLKLKVKA